MVSPNNFETRESDDLQIDDDNIEDFETSEFEDLDVYNYDNLFSEDDSFTEDGIDLYVSQVLDEFREANYQNFQNGENFTIDDIVSRERPISVNITSAMNFIRHHMSDPYNIVSDRVDAKNMSSNQDKLVTAISTFSNGVNESHADYESGMMDFIMRKLENIVQINSVIIGDITVNQIENDHLCITQSRLFLNIKFQKNKDSVLTNCELVIWNYYQKEFVASYTSYT